jgi:hypothetical protein
MEFTSVEGWGRKVIQIQAASLPLRTWIGIMHEAEKSIAFEL